MARFDYRQAREALYSLQRFGVKLGLTNVSALLERLGFPQDSFLSCHIAGTNGKGTCASVCDAVLRAHRVRTGLYTSPHLKSFTERIKCDGEPVPRDYVAGWVSDHLDYITEHRVTFFEAVTALAFDYFRCLGVQAAAVEAGLGGRFDATNVLSRMGLAVITSIGLDHTRYLGSTLANIAHEKAGIIKPGAPTILGDRKQRVIEVIASVAKDAGSPLLALDNEVSLKPVRRGAGEEESHECGLVFNYRSSGLRLERARVSLAGSHQMRNVGLGIRAAELILSKLGLSPEEGPTRSALENLRWPARFQRLKLETGMELILDVAHNPSAAGRLAHVFRRCYGPYARAVALVALAQDKDYASFLNHLLKIADVFIFPTVDFGRADIPRDGTEPRGMIDYVRSRSHGVKTVAPVGMKEALELAAGLSGGRLPVIVTGSFRTVGEVMQVLNIET
ncbi:MAG: Mur ligase family protein [Gemmatimonadota bacterium]|nr:Mur ligase family protein [Gemmatimonadota bacterium]